MRCRAAILLAVVLIAAGCGKNRSAHSAAAASSTSNPAPKTEQTSATLDGPAQSEQAAEVPVTAPAATPIAPVHKIKRTTPARSTSPIQQQVARSRKAAAWGGPAFEDPQQIQTDMKYDELLRRFGPPALSATATVGRSTLSYLWRTAQFQVEVENGRVIAVGAAGSH